MINYDPPFYNEYTPRPAENTVINNYTVSDFLFETNSSIVYRGLDTSNNRDVTLMLKKLKENQIGIIQDQINVLNLAHHPNVINLIYSFRYTGYVCLVFPYIQAGDLHEFLMRNYPDGIPEALASKIMKQLLESTKYLHSNNIIHLDINPQNILIDNADPDNFHILLSGTGFSKILPPGQLGDHFCGTPNFIAPEIYKHEQYDFKVDIWSLGITLFVMLSGQYPFHNMAALQLDARSIIEGRLKYDILTNKEISPEAIDLIRQMCRVEPETRMDDDDALNHPWILQNH